jgi:hypothetical protein
MRTLVRHSTMQLQKAFVLFVQSTVERNERFGEVLLHEGYETLRMLQSGSVEHL